MPNFFRTLENYYAEMQQDLALSKSINEGLRRILLSATYFLKSLMAPVNNSFSSRDNVASELNLVF